MRKFAGEVEDLLLQFVGDIGELAPVLAVGLGPILSSVVLLPLCPLPFFRRRPSTSSLSR